jgi:pyruvate,orthophosphate dikinase
MHWVFTFGNKKSFKRSPYSWHGPHAPSKVKEILGGKGAGLAEMTNIGIPVPPGFTISTRACVYYLKRKDYPRGLSKEIEKGIQYIESVTGRKYGDPENPLLVSVRSGARVSMPGMMDTVLNLGLNDITIEGLAKLTQNYQFALDSYRRFIQMFSDVVLGLPIEEFEKILVAEKKKFAGQNDNKGKPEGRNDSRTLTQEQVEVEMNDESLSRIVGKYKKRFSELTGYDFPQDPWEQLTKSIHAVFDSWNTERAQAYRKIYDIPEDWGTAVNVQAMVFGNMGGDSLTGVAFTRNPANGKKEFYGEYLNNAQGEDIVAGIRTPKPLEWLAQELPKINGQLENFLRTLERSYQDVQDVEFTVERGRLWILQTRRAKRTSQASVKAAVDMVREGLITPKDAVIRVTSQDVETLLHPVLDPTAKFSPLAKGIAASPGAISGEIVFSSERAIKLAEQGKRVILVRHQTSAEDVAGMAKSQGFLTATGGMTSHAAVVARGMGKPCVVGCEALEIDYSTKRLKVGDTVLKEGTIITIDGLTGRVILGAVPTINQAMSEEFQTILSWADVFRRLKVRANADTSVDAKTARDFGAQGIGLCRTEHMFFKPDRIETMQEMIIASDEAGRRKALAKLLPMQREDFQSIFKAMNGLPVTIRTLDPPLHEFLPKDDAAVKNLAQKLEKPIDEIKKVINQLHEANPMLGFRGCRLGIVYPEITEMQARAIFEAACEVKKEGVEVLPEVMIPLTGTVREFIVQKTLVNKIAQEVFNELETTISYLCGTMIEIPRAAITADDIARQADFFSYGTNDLTQTVFGFSRDDAGKFLPQYIDKRILATDPFRTLDEEGVGVLIKLGVRLGRRVKPDLKIGICGEHGGDPKSIQFCHNQGLDYVSCSPFRVPVARLAAAQAAINEKPSRARRGSYKRPKKTQPRAKKQKRKRRSVKSTK